MAYRFPEDTIAGLGAANLWPGLGLTVGFIISHLASEYVYVAVTLYLLLGFATVAVIFYITVLFTTKSVEQVFLYSVYCSDRVKNRSTCVEPSGIFGGSENSTEKIDEETESYSSSLLLANTS